MPTASKPAAWRWPAPTTRRSAHRRTASSSTARPRRTGPCRSAPRRRRPRLHGLAPGTHHRAAHHRQWRRRCRDRRHRQPAPKPEKRAPSATHGRRSLPTSTRPAAAPSTGPTPVGRPLPTRRRCGATRPTPGRTTAPEAAISRVRARRCPETSSTGRHASLARRPRMTTPRSRSTTAGRRSSCFRRLRAASTCRHRQIDWVPTTSFPLQATVAPEGVAGTR